MSTAVAFAIPALALGLAALLGLRLAPQAPPRLRFALAVLGLAAWLVPWPLLGLATLPNVPGIGVLAGTVLDGIRESVAARTPGGFSPAWCLAPFLPGLVLFAGDCRHYWRTVRHWQRTSRDGAWLLARLPATATSARITPAVRIVRDSSIAAATGVLKPTIWIGERLVGDEGLEAALLHEYCHVSRLDPLRLAAVTLVGRLYAWNPVVRSLACEAALALEAACDRACVRHLGQARYTRTLARLMLDVGDVPGTDLAPALGRSSNLKRIELLGRPSRMGTPAWSALTLAIAVGLAAVTASMAPPVRANVDDEARIAWSSAYGYAAPGGGLGTWTPVRADERPTNSD